MARRAVKSAAPVDGRDELVEALAQFYDDPLGFVQFAFPWGVEETELHDEDGPDAWQVEFLDKLGQGVRARMTDGDLGALLMAVASGHGVGKSAVVCWVIIWFASCRQNPAIVVTANTAGQLSSKTWRELAKWHRLAINSSWFQWTATKFYLKSNPDTWFASAIPWSKEKAEAFAGTHAKNTLLLFDEASAIDDIIYEVAEGALTTTGAIWLLFGNPTKNVGRFREAWRNFRHRWATVKVDSRTAKKANQAQIRRWIEDYGEDSDFVRVRVRGEFPRSASMQLISADTVSDAQMRYRARFGSRIAEAQRRSLQALMRVRLDDNILAPMLLMVDVARNGSDQSVVGIRQGRAFVVLGKYRELDGVQLSGRVAEFCEVLAPDQILVDGAGVGASVIDQMKVLGYTVTDVNFGAAALEPRKFVNRRAEMWWKMKDWLGHEGMVDPDDKDLLEDLIAPEYGFSDRGDRLQIESKDDMRARGRPSPDTADCLAMSFFMPARPRESGRLSVAEKLTLGADLYGNDGSASWMSH